MEIMVARVVAVEANLVEEVVGEDLVAEAMDVEDKVASVAMDEKDIMETK